MSTWNFGSQGLVKEESWISDGSTGGFVKKRPARAAAFWSPGFRRCVSRARGVSLASLLLGSTILFFVAINTPWSWGRPMTFKRGSHLPVQFWLAVFGVGFSLLAYGLSESYVHLFDVWCTWKAGSESGLDYARYLNTQPRAPAFVGLHGFRPFVLFRYLVILLGIAGSIGYKFAIIQITDVSLELGETAVAVNLPSTEPIDLETGATSSWLRDSPTVEDSRAFIHYTTIKSRHTNTTIDAMDRIQPPGTIFMSDEGDCLDTFHKFDEGILITLELVMVANMEVKHGDSDDFVELVLGGSKGLVIDYRNEQNGTLRIRWAEIPEKAITMSIKYTIGLTVAEVSQVVSSQGCWQLKEGLPLESEISIIPLWPPAMQNEDLIDMMLKDPKISVLDGVGLIASDSLSYTPGYAPLPWQSSRWPLVPPDFDGAKGKNGKYPKKHGRPEAVYLWLDPEFPRDHGNPTEPKTYSWRFFPREQTNPLSYPYYNGTTAVIFILLGVIGCSLVVIRLYLGLAGIASWMDQHVYLALEGKIQKDGSEILACGHRVAVGERTLRADNDGKKMVGTVESRKWVWDGVPSA
ncbi:hypothetical protein QBC36DRAFT_345177 [Triangularia setosa]|uniref:Uncharacterized protein n=1 Tax=Triangularia setosa TaxID=2587417 RepID=A0AAN7A758_9PEZI|nr:hypothetical protein QBC36DRAFT_345177 [Podospora setosa]